MDLPWKCPANGGIVAKSHTTPCAWTEARGHVARSHGAQRAHDVQPAHCVQQGSAKNRSPGVTNSSWAATVRISSEPAAAVRRNSP
jgi:hypothetical protein